MEIAEDDLLVASAVFYERRSLLYINDSRRFIIVLGLHKFILDSSTRRLYLVIAVIYGGHLT